MWIASLISTVRPNDWVRGSVAASLNWKGSAEIRQLKWNDPLNSALFVFRCNQLRPLRVQHDQAKAHRQNKFWGKLYQATSLGSSKCVHLLLFVTSTMETPAVINATTRSATACNMFWLKSMGDIDFQAVCPSTEKCPWEWAGTTKKNLPVIHTSLIIIAMRF